LKEKEEEEAFNTLTAAQFTMIMVFMVLMYIYITMAWYGIVYHIAMAQLQPASRSVGDVAAGVVESRIRIGVDMMTIVREVSERS
jgi:hypothetical protein